MNPQLHDEFVALSALFYSGDISEEEWALLQIHISYCDSCHERFLEYRQITSGAIPAMAAVAVSELDHAPDESAISLESAQRRLLSRLGALPPEQPGHLKVGWQLPLTLIAACGLCLVYLVGQQFARTKILSARGVQVAPVPRAAPREVSAFPDRVTEEALELSKEQVASLEQQISAVDNRLKQGDVSMVRIESQLTAAQEADKQLSDDRDRLTQQLAAAETELDSMRDKRAEAGTHAAQAAANTTALETEVRELKAALDEKDLALSEKDRMLTLDKDFLAHDRDIRDLIGARSLYIADIFDTTENGKIAKQFGRIFYTKDRSLIFYGFDLDSQAGRKHDVSFQVWGNRSDRAAPVSLGIFYQDDTHKRWVLRCNDAKTLARLDMVFVTVEPPGGSTTPTGKRLLRAYLQINPNHP